MCDCYLAGERREKVVYWFFASVRIINRIHCKSGSLVILPVCLSFRFWRIPSPHIGWFMNCCFLSRFLWCPRRYDPALSPLLFQTVSVVIRGCIDGRVMSWTQTVSAFLSLNLNSFIVLLPAYSTSYRDGLSYRPLNFPSHHVFEPPYSDSQF